MLTLIALYSHINCWTVLRESLKIQIKCNDWYRTVSLCTWFTTHHSFIISCWVNRSLIGVYGFLFFFRSAAFHRCWSTSSRCFMAIMTTPVHSNGNLEEENAIKEEKKEQVQCACICVSLWVIGSQSHTDRKGSIVLLLPAESLNNPQQQVGYLDLVTWRLPNPTISAPLCNWMRLMCVQ